MPDFGPACQAVLDYWPVLTWVLVGAGLFDLATVVVGALVARRWARKRLEVMQRAVPVWVPGVDDTPGGTGPGRYLRDL